MKRLLITLSCALFFLLSLSTYSFALPLELGPFYGNYQNWEMFTEIDEEVELEDDTTTTEPWTTEGNEDNWGILRATQYYNGSGEYEGIGSGNDTTWRDNELGRELTGIFYGIDAVYYDEEAGELGSIGGYLDIYSNPDGSLDVENLDPTDRIGDSGYAGITNTGDSRLLLSMEMVPGIETRDGTDLTVWSDNTELQDAYPVGQATSYLKIVDGAWAPYFEENYFAASPNGPGLNAELYSKNSFNTSSSDFDLVSEDPLRGNVVPEPTTLLLFGTGLLGLAAFGRKKFMKKS